MTRYKTFSVRPDSNYQHNDIEEALDRIAIKECKPFEIIAMLPMTYSAGYGNPNHVTHLAHLMIVYKVEE
jgi:hypothetical protein